MARIMDYTESADRLGDHEVVKEALRKYHEAKEEQAVLQAALEALDFELVTRIKAAGEKLAEAEKLVRDAVLYWGSYQNLETGDYAVRYARKSKRYDPEKLRKYHPKEAELAIMETVNVQALEGLIKGGLLDEKQLREKKILTEETLYVFYIR